MIFVPSIVCYGSPLQAWVDLKTHQDRYVTALDSIQFDVPGSCLMGRDREHHRRM